MIKSLKMKIVVLSLALLCAISLYSGKPVYASSYSFYISPSKIYNEHIELGDSKTFTIKVGSRILNEQNFDLENAEFDVEVEAELLNEEGAEISSDEIFEISKKEFKLIPGESENIDITVIAPEDIVSGNYTGYISFIKKEKKDDNQNVNATIDNVLRIPMYIFMGSLEEYENMVIDYELNDQYISAHGEKPTTITEEIKSAIFTLVNPFKCKTVFSELANRPYFNVVKNGKQLLDLNNNIYVSLREVSTQKDKTSDTKYFHFKEEDLNKNLGQAKIDSNGILLILEDNVEVRIPAVGENIAYIKNQLETLSNIKGDISLNYLLDNLLVPMNINYVLSKPALVTEVENKSNAPLTVSGELSVLKNNDVFYKTTIISPTIKINSSDNIKNVISNQDLTDGKYSIDGFIKMRDVEKKLNYQFEITNVRNTIMLFSGIFLAVYIVILLIIIRLIIVKVKKKNWKIKK